MCAVNFLWNLSALVACYRWLPVPNLRCLEHYKNGAMMRRGPDNGQGVLL